MSTRQISNTGKQSSDAFTTYSIAKLANSLLYGVVNAIRAIPTMYGYTVIIFSHPTFGSFMPALSKLVIFSSAVHQVMFTLMSSMPFAIGQVQDAGLIFLSAMATSICNSLGHDVSPEAKVATTIVTIGIATASLGVCLVVMGRFKLAALASYLPMPVIGGYLAFIGIFCLYAGMALSTGLVINDFSSMVHMFN
ncbi:Sulfate Permease (SulP) Family, partial [Phytophthora palmivora]